MSCAVYENTLQIVAIERIMQVIICNNNNTALMVYIIFYFLLAISTSMEAPGRQQDISDMHNLFKSFIRILDAI